jgi:hypothetical protein
MLVRGDTPTQHLLRRERAGPKPRAGRLLSSAIPQCHAVLRNSKSNLFGRRKMRSVHFSTKQVHLLRVLFSIGLTAFVGVGSFLALRYLIDLSAR